MTRCLVATTLLLSTMIAAPPFAMAQSTPASQEKSPPSSQDKKQPEKPPTPVTGEVVAVDPNAKTLTIKTAAVEQGEMKFSYGETTEIVGGDKDVAGLAGKAGTMVTVHYDIHGTANVATRIEIQPKK